MREFSRYSSSEDAEESHDGNCGGKPIPPVQVNSHLHRNDSLHLNMNCGPQTLKKQKYVSSSLDTEVLGF